MNELVKVENGEITVAEQVINKIIEFNKAKKEMEYQEKLLKEKLYEAMTEIGKTNFSLNGLSASIRQGSTRTTVDSKRLKAECPEIYEAYSKTTTANPTVILTIDD